MRGGGRVLRRLGSRSTPAACCSVWETGVPFDPSSSRLPVSLADSGRLAYRHGPEPTGARFRSEPLSADALTPDHRWRGSMPSVVNWIKDASGAGRVKR